jgi:RNA-directed DNA polymerase
LLDLIVDGSNAQEPVNLYYDGDDLFSPHERRRGLPIGNLTSQFFANLYLDGFDHFATEVLRAPYVRYVDDFALFHDDAAVLADWRSRIDQYLIGRRLKLHPQKTRIQPSAEPAGFLGYELYPGGYRRLPEDNIRRFRNRLRGLRDQWRAGTAGAADIDPRVRSWIAHANNADTWRLRHAIFEGGVYDPAQRSLDGPLSPCCPRRFLEQQSTEPPLGQPQQEHHRQSEQQLGFPCREHAVSQSRRDQGFAGRALCVQGRP